MGILDRCRPSRHRLARGLAVCALAAGCSAPGGSSDQALLGWGLLARGNHAEALAAFERELAHGSSAELHAGRGRALYGLERFEESRLAFEEAVETEPADGRWRLGHGLALLALGDATTAAGACELAIRLEPELQRAHYNLGLARLSEGSTEAALAAFTEAIRLDSGHAESYSGRGVARARLGRTSLALDDFERAARLRPLSFAHTNAAAAHYRLGDARRALGELNLAVRLDPDRPEPYVARGRIYLDLGQPSMAIEELLDALDLAPDRQDVMELLEIARAQVDVDGATDAAGPDTRPAAFGK